MALDSGTKLGAFEITGLLGKGGMGEVYRARDTKLGRDVAIKVLGDVVAGDPEYLKRFEKEAKVLASLSHANVGAIYEFQEADGVHFLVMELVEGDTLSDRIKRGPLSLREALPIFVQIARGLDAAHEVGIVHRDLKPANIKISPKGEVKVLDFGIAKDTTKAEIDHDAPTTPMTSSPVTGEGLIIGTPQYMSPEQARGKPVDKRTDVWAFGCCLYEALTARRPYDGETTTDIVAAILERDVNWSKLPELPPRILSILRRSLAKDPHKRLSSTSDIGILLEEAEDALNHPEAAAEAPSRSLMSPVLAAFVALIVGVGATFALTRGGDGGTPGATSNVVGEASDKITTIAVLPFDNFSGDESQEYFANGMTETLTAELAKIDSLTVKARTSAMRYKDTDKTLDQIAKELGVQGLIEGSIQRTENEVRITARLIDGTTAEHIWAGNFDGTVDNILRLQGEVAVAIAEGLDAALAEEVRAAFTRSASVDPAAWDLYLKAREAFRPRTQEGFQQAIDLLKGAIAADSEFADSYALLGLVHAVRPFNRVRDPQNVQNDIEAAIQYAQRALELNDRAIEAHFALAWASWPALLNREEGERHLRRALELEPDNAYAFFMQSNFASYSGRHAELSFAQEAADLDPMHPLYWQHVGAQLRKFGRLNDSLTAINKALELEPALPVALENLVSTYLAMGETENAKAAFERLEFAEESHLRLLEAVTLAKSDQPQEAQAVIESVEFSSLPLGGPIGMVVFLETGAVDRFIAYLEWMEANENWTQLVPITSRIYDKRIWEKTRFWALIERLNIPSFAPEHPAYNYQQAWLRKKAIKDELAAQPKPVRRYTIKLPFNEPVDGLNAYEGFALSPDGSTLAYIANIEGTSRLVIRNLVNRESMVVPETEGASSPFFSRDGKWIAFAKFESTIQLKRVSVRGGLPLSFTNDARDLKARGFDWGDDGYIIYGNSADGLSRVRAEGTGGAEELTSLKLDDDQIHHALPQLLPDGRNILYTILGTKQPGRLAIHSLETGETTIIAEDGFGARYLPTGHLIYRMGGTFVAARFDLSTLSIVGDPVPVQDLAGDNVGNDLFHVPYAASSDGTLLYMESTLGETLMIDPESGMGVLVWVDRNGVETPIAAPPRLYRIPSISPDGKRVAIEVQHPSSLVFDIWVHDFERGTDTRITRAKAWDAVPKWSADGQHVLFTSNRDGDFDLFEVPANGTGSPRKLVDADNNQYHPIETPEGGTYVVVDTEGLTPPYDISLLETEPETVLRPLLSSEYNETLPRLSPDGKWLAYVSHESGGPQIYVRPFPNVDDGKWAMTGTGGTHPRWGPRGDELFYLTDAAMYSVQVETSEGLQFSQPKYLFDTTRYPFNQGLDLHDMAPDGERFLFVKRVHDRFNRNQPTEFSVVTNWFEELNRLAPHPEAN